MGNPRPLPPLEFVLAHVSYDAETGIFTRTRTGRVAGQIKEGYRRIMFGTRKEWLAHRIAWLIYYGREPAGFIDHINGDRDDNRISNLRLATPTQNNANRKVKNRNGLKGIFAHRQVWAATICSNGQRHYLGHFQTKEEAHEAYIVAAEKIFGEFARAK